MSGQTSDPEDLSPVPVPVPVPSPASGGGEDGEGGEGGTRLASLSASRAWRDGQVVDTDVVPEEIPALVADPDTLVWIDLLEPSTADLHRVVGSLGLPPTAVEDVLGRFERPKIVHHDRWTYVTTSAIRLDADAPGPDGGTARDLVRMRVSAIATASALVTIRLDPRWDMDEVVRRWEEDPDLIGRGVPALLHGLLDAVVDGHFDVLQDLDDRAEDLEDELLGDTPAGDSFIRELYALRKHLVRVRRVVVPMRDVVSGIERRPTSGAAGALSQEMAPWWGDLYDHVLRASEWADSLRDMIAFMVETQMSLMDWRLNIVMKKLAGWAAIIAVPTLITGWYGQNVAFPGNGTWGGLAVSTALLLISSVTLYVVFRRRDWL